MIRFLRACAAGAWAGISAARWLSRDRLEILLDGRAGGIDGIPAGAHTALLISRAVVRLWSAVPFSTARPTCLYRSVAECLVLRRYGVTHRLCIGVRREGDGPVDVHAHAWVERGSEPRSEPFVPLERESPVPRPAPR